MEKGGTDPKGKRYIVGCKIGIMTSEQDRAIEKVAAINKEVGLEHPTALWKKSYLYFAAGIVKGSDTVLKKLEGIADKEKQTLQGINALFGKHKKTKPLVNAVLDTITEEKFEALLANIVKESGKDAETKIKEYFRNSNRFGSYDEKQVVLFIKYFSFHPDYLLDAVLTIKGKT